MKENKESPLVSVVILNYNGLKYLPQTIESIKKIDYPNLEMVVVDNCSTDGSIEFLSEMAEVRMVKNSHNIGYSAGKNIGVLFAKGEYVLLLDDDILISEKFRLINCLDKLRSGKVLSISFLLKDLSTEFTEYYGGYYANYGMFERRRIHYREILNKNEDYYKVGSPDGGALLLSKHDFILYGGYDIAQPYFLDVGDFGLRASILSAKSNVLYTKTYFTHLGEVRKTDTDAWCWKFQYVLPGLTRIIFKNYTYSTIYTSYPIVFLFVFLKMLKQIMQRRDLKIVRSYLRSVYMSFESIFEVKSDRVYIQGHRLTEDDNFMKIRPFRIKA